MSKPKIYAFEGMGQRIERFAQASQIEQCAEKYDCSLQFMDTPNRWSFDAVKEFTKLIDRQRNSFSKAYLVGFSLGARYVNAIAARLPLMWLGGMWLYSGNHKEADTLAEGKHLWAYKDRQHLRHVRVVLSCNNGETKRLPRWGVPWYSMMDYRDQLAERYVRHGLTIKTMEGEGGHRWDSGLNDKAMQFLLPGKHGR